MSKVDDLRDMVRRYPDKMIIGANRTVKLLKLGRVSKVFLASNVPEDLEKDIIYYAKLSGAEVVKLDIANDDLGAVVGKPFKIAVLSFVKG